MPESCIKYKHFFFRYFTIDIYGAVYMYQKVINAELPCSTMVVRLPI